jgi:hypothetical protein
MTWMFLCECFIYYYYLTILFEYPNVTKFYKIREIFSYLTFNDYNSDLVLEKYSKEQILNLENDDISPSILSLLRLNSSLYTGFMTFSLNLNIFYCIEVIFMIAHPISDWTKRYTIYMYLSFFTSIFSFLFTIFFNFDYCMSDKTNVTYQSIIQSLFYMQSMNLVLCLIFMIIGIISVVYIGRTMLTKSKFYSLQRKIFVFRHIMYIIIFIGMWVYPVIGIYCNEVGKKSVKIY